MASWPSARPSQERGDSTSGVLGMIAIFLFLGVTYLAYATHAMPSTTDSVLSQTAAAVWHGPAGGQIGYYLVQIFTFGVLVFAANTAFQGFPRLIGMMAQSNHAPRLFQYVGDRLVYSNGVTALAVISGVLLIAFDANVNNLIHLYLLGVFLAFTLSQAGMVRFWLRKRHEGATWHGLAGKIAINAAGAIATGIVLVIILGTKFFEGAWMVTVTISDHRRAVDLRAPTLPAGRCAEGVSPDEAPGEIAPPCGIAVLVDRVDEGTAAAVQTAKLIAQGAPVTGCSSVCAPTGRPSRRPGAAITRSASRSRGSRAATGMASTGCSPICAACFAMTAPICWSCCRSHNRRVSHAAFRGWRQYRRLRTRLLRQPENRGRGDAQVDCRTVVGGRPCRQPRRHGQVQQAIIPRRCGRDGDLGGRHVGGPYRRKRECRNLGRGVA